MSDRWNQKYNESRLNCIEYKEKKTIIRNLPPPLPANPTPYQPPQKKVSTILSGLYTAI